MAAILKKPLNRHLRKHLTDFEEFWQCDADCSHTGDRPLNFRIFKNQDGGGRHLEHHKKSRYHFNGLTDLSEIWHDYAKWVS